MLAQQVYHTVSCISYHDSDISLEHAAFNDAISRAESRGSRTREGGRHRNISFSDRIVAFFGDGVEKSGNLCYDLKKCKNGVDVSGGEAQKIAIARALYKDAPFIILDEPTAALDPIAEAEIYGKFDEIAGDKTAIYISHRLSSCKFCDEIAVFHGGAVIQQGSHASLVADESGKYYELWHAQAQYYSENETN